MRRSQDRPCRAFTLYEIMAVVVLIGIASTLIVPQLSGNDVVRLRAATQQLTADLLYARSQAVNNVRKYYIVFGSQSYALQTRASDSDPMSNLKHPVSPGNYKISLNTGNYKGVTVSSWTLGGTDTLAFNELGSPYAYSNSTNALNALTTSGKIILSCGQNRMTIWVEPWSGEISVTEN